MECHHTSSIPSGNSSLSFFPSETRTTRSVATDPAYQRGWSSRSSLRFWCSDAPTGESWMRSARRALYDADATSVLQQGRWTHSNRLRFRFADETLPPERVWDCAPLPGQGVTTGGHEHLALNTDFAPTVADLAGAVPPYEPNGRSFVLLPGTPWPQPDE